MKKSKWYILLPWMLVFSPFGSYAQMQVSNNTSVPAMPKSAELLPTTSSKAALSTYNEALTYYDVGNTVKARALFSKAIEQDPSFGMAYLLRANLATSSKEFTDDVNLGRSKMSNASEWEKLYGDYLYTNLTGDRIKGLELARQIAQANPGSARAQQELGNAYSNSNQFANARQAYAKAADLNNKWVGGYNGLAASYLFNDPIDLKKAEQNALKALALEPKNSGTQILIGDVYRAQNDFLKARNAYEKAVELDPSDPAGYYKMGHANVYLGNFDEARKNYAAGAALDTRASFGESMSAMTYLFEGDNVKAMNTFINLADKPTGANTDKSISQSDQSNFLNNAAIIAFEAGDSKALNDLIPKIEAVDKEIYSQIGTTEAMNMYAGENLNRQVLLAISEGRYDEADMLAEKMKTAIAPLKDDRKLETYHFDKGMIALKQKNYKAAVTHFEMGDPLSVYNKYYLARAHEGMGNNTKANALYKEIGAYNFNNLQNAIVRREVKEKLKK